MRCKKKYAVADQIVVYWWLAPGEIYDHAIVPENTFDWYEKGENAQKRANIIWIFLWIWISFENITSEWARDSERASERESEK